MQKQSRKPSKEDIQEMANVLSRNEVPPCKDGTYLVEYIGKKGKVCRLFIRPSI